MTVLCHTAFSLIHQAVLLPCTIAAIAVTAVASNAAIAASQLVHTLLQPLHVRLVIQLLIPLHLGFQAAPAYRREEGVPLYLVHAAAAQPLLWVPRQQAPDEVFSLGVKLRSTEQNSIDKLSAVCVNKQRHCN